MDVKLFTKPHLIKSDEKKETPRQSFSKSYNTHLFVLLNGKSIKNQVFFLESEYLLIIYVSKGMEKSYLSFIKGEMWTISKSVV